MPGRYAELGAQAVVEERQNLGASGHYSQKNLRRLEVCGPEAGAVR